MTQINLQVHEAHTRRLQVLLYCCHYPKSEPVGESTLPLMLRPKLTAVVGRLGWALFPDHFALPNLNNEPTTVGQPYQITIVVLYYVRSIAGYH